MKENKRLYVDTLTGVYNRAFLEEKIDELIEKTRSEGRTFQLVIFDVDYFKRVNDFYGHSVGDLVLREFTEFLKSSLRMEDIVIRYGGDEFIAILFDVEYEEAIKIVERILARCKEREFSKIKLTASAGIASFQYHADTWDKLFELADRSLLAAKRQGRSRIGTLDKLKTLSIPTHDLIGREEEVAKIISFLTSKGQPGGFVLVKGEIGIGKTRLVKEVLNYPQLSGFIKVEVTLSPVTQSVILYSVRAILKQLVKENVELFSKLSASSMGEISKLFPPLGEKNEEPVYVIDKFRLFDAIQDVLEIVTNAGRTLLLFVDNVQWADLHSLEVFHFIARSSIADKVPMIFTSRIEEMHREETLSKLITNIVREAPSLIIDLGPLKIEGVHQLITCVLGQDVPEEFTRFLVAKGGGNPYILYELIKYMVSTGDIYWAHDRWEFRTEISDNIPDSINVVVEMRLSNLNEVQSYLLEILSVFGRPFNLELVKEISRMDYGVLNEILDQLIKLGFIEKTDSYKYNFTADIVRDAIYFWMDGERRRVMHHMVAEVLRELFPEDLEEIAYHYYKSGDFSNAIDFCMKSIEKAIELYSYREAAKYCSWAIDCLDSSKDIEEKEIKKINILNKLADVYNLLGEPEKAIANCEEAIKLAQLIGDKSLEAPALCNLGYILEKTARFFDAIDKFKQAYNIFEGLKDSGGMALSYLGMGLCYSDLAKYNVAQAYLDKSMELASSAGRQDILANAMRYKGVIYDRTCCHEEALEWFRKASAIYEELHDERNKISVLCDIASTYSMYGNLDKALELYNAALEAAERIGYLRIQGSILHNIGVTYLFREPDFSKAQTYFEKSANILHITGNVASELSALRNLGIIFNETGNCKRAIEIHRKTLKMAREIKDKNTEAFSLLSLGIDFLDLGYFRKALKLLTKALSLSEKINMPYLKAVVLAQIGTVYYSIGEFNLSESYFLKSLEIFESLKLNKNIAEVYVSLAFMFLDSGDLDKAEYACNKLAKLIKKIDGVGLYQRFKLVLYEIRMAKGERISERQIAYLVRKCRDEQQPALAARCLMLSGKVKTANGHYKEAERDFEEAISILRNIGHRYDLARTYAEYANCLEKAGDLKRAENYRRKAISVFKKLSVPYWAERIKSNSTS